MTSRDTILQVQDLSLNMRQQKQEKPILHEISLNICRGEKWAIAGESGAGKSMTMYALASLLPEKNTVLTGKIEYRESDGSYTDILALPYQERTRYCAKKVSLIFQDSINALNPFETVGAQWCHTLKYSHPEMKKAERTSHILARLADFGITDGQVTRKYPHQLSGGMKQRIAMAMAMESEAQLLIADEPTTSLDAVNQRKAVEQILGLCEKNHLTMLYISHNLALLREICTNIAVFKDGRIIETGRIGEVFENPVHPYTKKLIEETKKLML